MTIQKLLILFSTISIIYGRPQNNEDRNKYFEDLMKEIFYSNETTPKNTQYKSCGFQKECVPRYLCNDGHVNEYGVGIVDIRSDAYEECVFLEICCNVSDEVQEPVTFKPQPVESNSNNLNDSAPANNSNPIKTHEQLNMRNGCGYRNINGIKLIINLINMYALTLIYFRLWI